MVNRLTVQYVAAVVAAVFAVGIWLSGEVPKASWLRYYSLAVTLAMIGLLLWEHWIWRWRIVQRIPKVARSIRGTWQGTLTSQWIDPKSGVSPPPKTVYSVVRQTASTTKLMLVTNESTSKSSIGELTHSDGSWYFTYIYLNEPELSFEDRSRMHHGSASYTLVGSPVTRMGGRYWTDRNSRGEIQFTVRRRDLADDYESAKSLFTSVT